MLVIEGLDALRRQGVDAASVVCVGVFDGVHLGHQRLLHELLELASELRGVPTVVTFRNHPDALLRGSAPPLLVSVPHRLRLLRRAGVQRLLLLEFDARLRAQSIAEFARAVLHDGLRAKGLLLGYDSALGHDREGTPERCRALGQELGFTVREAQPFTVDGQAVSSTAIRRAIAAGDLDGARRLLGRWPSALGEVVHGDGRGKGLGFPTANVVPQSPVLPPHGVYAARVLHDAEPWPAVVNLGTRPTFDPGATRAWLEAHLLGFAGELYGATLEVCFERKLRDEQRFASREALLAQIQRDVAQARALLLP